MNKQEIIYTVLVLVIIGILYYFGTMQNRKIQKELAKIQDSVKKGDNVETFSGLCGIVEEIANDEDLVLKLKPDNVRITIKKWSVSKIINNK